MTLLFLTCSSPFPGCQLLTTVVTLLIYLHLYRNGILEKGPLLHLASSPPLFPWLQPLMEAGPARHLWFKNTQQLKQNKTKSNHVWLIVHAYSDWFRGGHMTLDDPCRSPELSCNNLRQLLLFLLKMKKEACSPSLLEALLLLRGQPAFQ